MGVPRESHERLVCNISDYGCNYHGSLEDTMRLKRWESPRRQGRNDKGRGGSARARQRRKQQQQLRRRLTASSPV